MACSTRTEKHTILHASNALDASHVLLLLPTLNVKPNPNTNLISNTNSTSPALLQTQRPLLSRTGRLPTRQAVWYVFSHVISYAWSDGWLSWLCHCLCYCSCQPLGPYLVIVLKHCVTALLSRVAGKLTQMSFTDRDVLIMCSLEFWVSCQAPFKCSLLLRTRTCPHLLTWFFTSSLFLILQPYNHSSPHRTIHLFV